MTNQGETPGKWYRLDNAAHIYPAIKNQKHPGVFRLSATLNDEVKPEILQKALDDTLFRIPSFSVKIRPGLFWNYFSHSSDRLPVQKDVINPCMEISRGENTGFLIRVRYHHCTIAVEIFHSISDGSGGMSFLKTLVAQYLRMSGKNIPYANDILNCSETPQAAEAFDSFRSFAEGSKPINRREPRAYQISGKPLAPHLPVITIGTIPLTALQKVTKKYNVSITEYLTAVYIHILNCIQSQEKPFRMLPVRIQVPVNLRRFHQTSTLRNFSSYVNTGIDPNLGNFDFENVLKLTHHFLGFEVNENFLRRRVAGNLYSENHPLVRVIPLFLKNPIINLGYRSAGPSIFSSILSNLGNIELPSEMVEHVKMFGFILGASLDTKVKCSFLGYKGQLRINFTRLIEEAFVERAFFTFLVEQNIPVLIESNQE